MNQLRNALGMSSHAGSSASADDLYEQAEQQATYRELRKMNNDCNSLEAAHIGMQSLQRIGGKGNTAALIASANSMLQAMGIDPEENSLPGMQSFGPSDTTAGMQGIGAWLKRIWDAIVKFFKDIYKKVADWFNGVDKEAKKIKGANAKLRTFLEGLADDAESKNDKVSMSKSYAYLISNGKIDHDDKKIHVKNIEAAIKSYHTDTVIKFYNDYADKVVEALEKDGVEKAATDTATGAAKTDLATAMKTEFKIEGTNTTVPMIANGTIKFKDAGAAATEGETAPTMAAVVYDIGTRADDTTGRIDVNVDSPENIIEVLDTSDTLCDHSMIGVGKVDKEKKDLEKQGARIIKAMDAFNAKVADDTSKHSNINKDVITEFMKLARQTRTDGSVTLIRDVLKTAKTLSSMAGKLGSEYR